MTRSMGGNKLEGSVPSSLSALKKLEVMYDELLLLNFNLEGPLHWMFVRVCYLCILFTTPAWLFFDCATTFTSAYSHGV